MNIILEKDLGNPGSFLFASLYAGQDIFLKKGRKEMFRKIPEGE